MCDWLKSKSKGTAETMQRIRHLNPVTGHVHEMQRMRLQKLVIDMREWRTNAMRLETVALVLLVKLLVDRHHLGVGARLDVVPGGGVVLSVPDDVWAARESAQVPVEMAMAKER